MAVKKWPKWLVGFSSVASFTGFLFLIQHPMDAGTATVGVDGNLAGDSIKSLKNIETNALPLPESLSVQSGTSAGVARTFVRSRAEFQQISELSVEKKAERELQLEQLDWDGVSGNGTLVAPIKTATTLKAKSDVRSRRS